MDKSLFWKKLKPLVFPIAFQQLMLALVSASDAVMLVLVDQASLSAVSLAAQVQFVLGLFLAAFTIGGNILAAQYWGKGEKDGVEQVFAIMLRPAMAVGAVFTAAAALVPELLMRCFTPEQELIRLGAEYLRTVSPAYLLCGISQCYLCIMKNTGRAGTVSAVSTVCVVTNIILNAILILGLLGAPALGIRGAAIATVAARVIELAWALWDTGRRNPVRLRKKNFLSLRLPLERDYWKYTSPVLGNELVWGVGFTMGSVILGHLGSDAVAANSITGVVKNLLACFCMGLGMGGGILVGNELGGGRLETARQYGDRLIRLAFLSGGITGGILLLASPVILHAVTLTPQAESYLVWMLVICSVNIVGMACNVTSVGGIFCAGGDSKFGFLCDAVTLWAVIVPAGLLAAFVFKLPVVAVYLIISMDEIVKLPAVLRHYKKYKWVRDLTVPEAPEKSTDKER